MGSHEVAGKGYVFTKTSQMASIGVIFITTYHTKQLNPWPDSSASRVVNYSQLSACQGDMQPFEGDPYTRGRLTSLRNKPQLRLHQNKPNGIHWCHFHHHISHKAVKSMARLISQSCGELQPAVCLPRGYAAI